MTSQILSSNSSRSITGVSSVSYESRGRDARATTSANDQEAQTEPRVLSANARPRTLALAPSEGERETLAGAGRPLHSVLSFPALLLVMLSFGLRLVAQPLTLPSADECFHAGAQCYI